MRLLILAFASGVLLLQTQPELPAPEAWALAGLLLVLPRCRWSSWPVRLLAIAGCFALGFSWAGWRADLRLTEQLASEFEGRDVEVIGVIATLPQDFSNGTRFEFVVDSVLTPGVVVPGRVMLSWYQGRRDGEQFERLPVQPGERWRFTLRLKRPHGNANPGGFDYEAWLLEHDIRATGYIRPEPPQRLSEMVWQPDYLIERLRFQVRARYAERLPPEIYPWSGILVALAVGDQKAIQVLTLKTVLRWLHRKINGLKYASPRY
jgi:competence protein ComEC